MKKFALLGYVSVLAGSAFAQTATTMTSPCEPVIEDAAMNNCFIDCRVESAADLVRSTNGQDVYEIVIESVSYDHTYEVSTAANTCTVVAVSEKQ